MVKKLNCKDINYFKINKIKSRILRKEFPELKKWCKQNLWAPSCYHENVGHDWEVAQKYIEGQDRKSRVKYYEQALELIPGYVTASEWGALLNLRRF